MNKRILLQAVLYAILPLQSRAQEAWNMDRCMDYAVKHAHRVQSSRVEAENAELSMERARGAFIPYLSGGVGGQLSWGRNVDPETNTYNTITTLNNSYSLSTGVTLWDGMQSVNALRQARLNMRQSRNALQEMQDRVAMDVMQLFIEALYAEHSTRLAREKEDDSRRLLERTRLMAELGEKGRPDVAQMEAQMANDSYEAVRQQNAAEKALNALKLAMNFPAKDELQPVVLPSDTAAQMLPSAGSLYRIPALISAENNVELQRYSLRMTKGRLSPTLSVGAGIGTSYYRNLTTGAAVTGFGKQWKNNMGEYVSASLSLPLFQFTTYKDIRRARNQVRLAQLDCDETLRQTREAYRQAQRDARGSRREVELMHAKVESDSIAHRLNVRRYEEGLLSALDLQSSAQTLHQSRIRLLQVGLTLAMQERVVRYYETGIIYNENK